MSAALVNEIHRSDTFFTETRYPEEFYNAQRPANGSC